MEINSLNSQPIDPLAASSQSKEVINFSGGKGQRTVLEGSILAFYGSTIQFLTSGPDTQIYYLTLPEGKNIDFALGKLIQISVTGIEPRGGIAFDATLAQIKVGF